MRLNNYLRLLAGFFTVVSVILAMYFDGRFLYFTLFVGINQIQSAFTNWCPAIWFLKKINIKE